MTPTFSSDNVERTGAPLFTAPNIEPSMLHALLKSVALKNTQVTFIKKKVNRANKKFAGQIFLRNRGAVNILCTTTFSFLSIETGMLIKDRRLLLS